MTPPGVTVGTAPVGADTIPLGRPLTGYTGGALVCDLTG